jgi:hypothetical protein
MLKEFKNNNEMKIYKLPSISAEMIQAGGNTFRSDIYKRTIWNQEELPRQWKESITVPIYK